MMSSGTPMLGVRPAEASDLDEIHTLWRSNPVGGQAPYYYDAPPTGKPGYRLYLVQWEGRPVGTFSLSRESLGDSAAFYVSDVVLARSFRGRRLIHHALVFILEQNPEVSFLSALYPEQNRNSRAMFKWKRLRVLLDRPFEILYLPSLWTRAPEIARDYAEVCALVNAFYAGHSLFQPVSPEDLARRRDFEVMVEREGGRVVACVGVWRQRAARRLMLVHPPFGTRLGLRVASLFNPAAQAVRENGAQELVSHALTEPAFAPGAEQAFGRLLGKVGWRRDSHSAQVVVDPSGAIAAQVKRRRFVEAFHARYVVFQYERQRGKLPPIAGPLYRDLSWL